MPGGWVYIVTNKPHGVLYTGVTADLAKRIVQHREGTGSSFARKHHCTRLVYAEPHDRIEEAIAREKAIKDGGGSGSCG
jgi:putative endonuclease